MATEIDVVIVTWRGRELLASCLDHLRRQTVDHHVIVVDNDSRDGTVELVREQYPDVSLLEMGRNAGFGVANNRGVELGTAPYLVLVNNDVDVEPDFLERAVAPLRDDPRCGAVATLTTRPDSGLVDQIGIELDPGLGAYSRGTGQVADALSVGTLAAPCAGAAAYRRTAFDQVGGFDEALFAYSEDLDLGLRLRNAGWEFAEARDARGVHLGGATTGNGSPMQRRLSSFGRGFILGRYRIGSWRGRLHALIAETGIVAWGLLRHRTVVPLTERVRGAMASRRTPRQPLDGKAIAQQIGISTALRRLARGE